MKKIINLTEQDLVRIIKRVVNEQASSRPYDKMVVDCLTKSGFKSSGGEKYEVFMEKKLNNGAIIRLVSQSKPELFNMTIRHNGKVLANENINVSKLDCKGLNASINKTKDSILN